jgi:hypothetical protein
MTTARAEQTHSDKSLWLKWVVATTASYAIGVAINGAMGEVVGEALGGEVLHKLGHTVGMGLFGAIVVLAQWPVLQQQVDWAGRWAVATIMGYSLGVLVYGSVLVLAPRATPIEVELALTTFVPLGGAALAQWLVLRQRIAGAGRWALAYVVLFVVGWIVIWLLIGGVAGLAADGLYPVVDSAVRYALRQIPSGLVGGAVFGATSGTLLHWLLRQHAPRYAR